MRHGIALALPAAATSTNDGSSRSLLDAWHNLRQIAIRINDEFQKVVQNQAQQIATADPATFDITTFVTGWSQQTEIYRRSTEAVSSFGAELDKLIGGYADQGSDELIEAAKEKRQALQELLDKRNETDALIEEQIKALDKLIGYSSGATQISTQKAPLQAAQLARKRAAKKATKKAAPQAAKQAAKKEGKK